MSRAWSTVERLFGVQIRPVERRFVVVLALDLFVLLTSYYVLKVIREPLILLEGGAVSRSYARGLQAFLLLALVPAYGLVADRLDPRRLVPWILGAFALCLVAFRLLAGAGVPVGFAFFVWVGIMSTMAIAQFWSLVNDLVTEGMGKRLFPVVAAGGTLGAVAGAQLAARLVEALGALDLMLVAAALLAGCALLVATLTRDGAAPAPAEDELPAADPAATPREGGAGGFRLVLRSPYLLLVAAAVVLLNVVNTTGDFVLARIVADAASVSAAGAGDVAREKERLIGTFYGNFQTWVSALTALAQFFLVARLFRALGVGRSLLLLPLVALGGYGALALVPLLLLAAIVKVGENSLDYSLQNTIQQALFLPTSRGEKYKAKAAIDTFFVRIGDLVSAGVVAVGVAVGLGVTGFSVVNAAVAALWTSVAIALGRLYRAQAREEGAASRKGPGHGRAPAAAPSPRFASTKAQRSRIQART
jgi:AAA family ATP:ADP antiporter